MREWVHDEVNTVKAELVSGNFIPQTLRASNPLSRDQNGADGAVAMMRSAKGRTMLIPSHRSEQNSGEGYSAVRYEFPCSIFEEAVSVDVGTDRSMAIGRTVPLQHL